MIQENQWLDWRDSLVNKFYGYDLFDVQKITQLPLPLLDQLSWNIGQNTDFFAAGEFAGWPLRVLPIHTRPFVGVGGRHYCFNLWALMDNFYRVMQRMLCRLHPEYQESWNKRQKSTSESVPFVLLKRLVPFATVYRSVFYKAPLPSGKLEWHEVDGLVVFDDHLLVAEIKAGAFTAAPPTTDFDAHIRSVHDLIRAPVRQAGRFVQRLASGDEVILHDENHHEIARLKRNQFRIVTPCCITLDNLTELGARIQHLKPLGVDATSQPIWVVSVDDLRAYADIFDSGVAFAHFMEQRRKAAQSKSVHLHDELDHLGLYLAFNMYVEHTEELSKSGEVRWGGYRRDLDIYFSRLITEPEKAVKPGQKIPEFLAAILHKIETQVKPGRCKVSSYLLDMDGSARQKFSEGIQEALHKQSTRGSVMPVGLTGETKICAFCFQPGIERLSLRSMQDYVLAFLKRANESERLLLIITLDSANNISDVSFQFLRSEDIEPWRQGEIESLSTKYAQGRLQTALKYRHKIGRNETCPCGSGKKYKRCCGL